MVTCPKCNAPENALRWQFWQGNTFRCTLCGNIFTTQSNDMEYLPLETESSLIFNENPLTKKEEPLIDVFEETDAIKIYIEATTDIKHELQLEVSKNRVEIATREFFKVIDLSAYDTEPGKTYYRCSSRMLEITIPKNEKVKILATV